MSEAEAAARQTVTDWNREHPKEAPFHYWGGGDGPPEDWDGGVYLCRDGQAYHMCGYDWGHGTHCWNPTADWDRIGYRKATQGDRSPKGGDSEAAPFTRAPVAESDAPNPHSGNHHD